MIDRERFTHTRHSCVEPVRSVVKVPVGEPSLSAGAECLSLQRTVLIVAQKNGNMPGGAWQLLLPRAKARGLQIGGYVETLAPGTRNYRNPRANADHLSSYPLHRTELHGRRHEHAAQPEQQSIKRVIGLPGDTIVTTGETVQVNGVVLKEPYISAQVNPGGKRWVVPPNDYFVLGDNRPVSDDSRDWGYVPRSYIIGKAVLVYWPVNNWQIINTYSPVFSTIKVGT